MDLNGMTPHKAEVNPDFQFNIHQLEHRPVPVAIDQPSPRGPQDPNWVMVDGS